MKSLIGLVLHLSLMIVTVNCDEFAECQNVTSPQFIALPDNCFEYIHCDGLESFQGRCPDEFAFNPLNAMCDDPSKVNCSTTGQNQTTQATTNINPSIITTTQAPGSSSPAQNTTAIAPSTQSPLTVPTVPTNTSSSPSTTSSGSGTTSAVSICPPSNSNQPENFPKPGSCTEYYLCFNGSPIEMQCPYSLQFSSVSKQCVWADEANCVANPTTTVRPIDLCTNGMNGFFKYPQNCHYYYRCTSGMLIVQECPLNYGWDDRRKSCTPTGCSLTN